MANSLLRRPASGSTRWDSLALLGDDLDESASKLADDVLPTIHPSFSSDMGASGKANRDDRLSNLPDHILLTILDRLDVCGSARTCVLSRRWSQLPAMLCQLIISVWDFLPEDVCSFQTDDMVWANAAVIEMTKSTLALRDSSQNSIHLLSLTFFLGDDDPISIGHVAPTMATQKVEMSEFTILTEVQSSECNDDDLVDYGRQFMLFFDACPDAFDGLTCLDLANLRFCESGIPNILTTCKRLKYLCLANCDSGEWTMLQVEHLQLSELSIIDCCFRKVMLKWLLKLIRMTLEGWVSFDYPLSVGYVPLLEAVNLSNGDLSWHKMVELSKFLGSTSVRDLKLGFKCEKIRVQPECVTKRLASVFHQLRFVNLFEIPEGYDLSWTLFTLEAVPPSRNHLYLISSSTVWPHSPSSASNLKSIWFGCTKCRGKHPRRYRFPKTKLQKSSMKKRITNGIDSFAIIHFPIGKEIRADHVAKLNYP